MLKNRNQNVWILLLSFEKKVQDRRLNKCNFIFFLLITLRTFIKTTTDYNLTICVKKRNSNKTPNPDCSCFFLLTVQFFLFMIIQTTPQQALVLSLVNRKKVDYTATPYLQYIIYIFIYIYLYHTGCNYDKIYS